MNPLGQNSVNIKDYFNLPLKAITALGHAIVEIANLIVSLVRRVFDAISSVRASHSVSLSSSSRRKKEIDKELDDLSALLNKASAQEVKPVVRMVRDLKDTARIEGEYVVDKINGDPAAKQVKGIKKAGIGVVRAVEDAIDGVPSVGQIVKSIEKGFDSIDKKFDKFIKWMESDD